MTGSVVGTSGIAALFQGSARYVPATPWGALSALTVTVLACLASLAAPFVIVILVPVLGDPDAAIDGTVMSMASLATPIGLLTALLSQLISLAVVWWAAGRGGLRRDVLRLGAPKPGWGACVLAGLLVVAASGALELAMYLAVGFDPFADAKWLTEGLRSPLWWGTVLVAIVLAPLWEELAFRGFLLSALAQSRLGFAGGALIANMLWTLLHLGYSYPGLASVFVAGLLMAWLMWRTGSMRTVVVAHAVANASSLAFTYSFAPVSPA